MFQDYTPIYDFNLLMESIPEFAKNDRLRIINSRIDGMEDTINLMAKQDAVFRRIDEMREHFVIHLEMRMK